MNIIQRQGEKQIKTIEEHGQKQAIEDKNNDKKSYKTT